MSQNQISSQKSRKNLVVFHFHLQCPKLISEALILVRPSNIELPYKIRLMKWIGFFLRKKCCVYSQCFRKFWLASQNFNNYLPYNKLKYRSEEINGYSLFNLYARLLQEMLKGLIRSYVVAVWVESWPKDVLYGTKIIPKQKGLYVHCLAKT